MTETNLPSPPVDPRQRLRELNAIPERDRTDEEWDEMNELEIQLAPCNRIGAPPAERFNLAKSKPQFRKEGNGNNQPRPNKPKQGKPYQGQGKPYQGQPAQAAPQGQEGGPPPGQQPRQGKPPQGKRHFANKRRPPRNDQDAGGGEGQSAAPAPAPAAPPTSSGE